MFAESNQYLTMLVTDEDVERDGLDREQLEKWLGEDILLTLEIEDVDARTAWMIAWAHAWTRSPEQVHAIQGDFAKLLLAAKAARAELIA